MSETVTYQYSGASTLEQGSGEPELFLAKFSEIEKKEAPCFFWGRLTDPYHTARCLITLSNIVQSSFSLSPADIARLKDPIVTAGNDHIRFEGFSQCAGVYGRVDVLPDGHDGEFLENGTTNVDFNTPMIAALSRVQKSEKLLLSVGKKEVSIQKNGSKVIERKVPLPSKWIKGLTSVQLFLAASEQVHAFTRIQALQLFQSIPNGKPKADYYLVMRGSKPMFSPIASGSAICVGGIQRLKLLESLLPFITELRVFPHTQMQSTTWQLYFGKVRFTFSLSRDAWRGFSGEGAGLEALVAEVPDEWIDAADKYSYANQVFNPALAAMEEGISMEKIDQLAARLSAMGLLGYDLDGNNFFYRRLPFKLSRILSLNPRMKDAEKLVAENKVEILSIKGKRIEAKVAGTGVHHAVLLNGEEAQCTCTWYSRHQGERGPCKHVLAVKKKIQ